MYVGHGFEWFRGPIYTFRRVTGQQKTGAPIFLQPEARVGCSPGLLKIFPDMLYGI